MSQPDCLDFPEIVLGYQAKPNASFLFQNLLLSFTFDDSHLKSWDKCSLISNFLGSYYSMSHEHNSSNVLSIVSTISNELIENALKFSHTSNKLISIKLFEEGNNLYVSVHNFAGIKNAQKVFKTLELLKESDLNILYRERVLHNTEYASENSEIGLISLSKDYSAQIGAKFKDTSEDMVSVEVFVCIGLNSLT